MLKPCWNKVYWARMNDSICSSQRKSNDKVKTHCTGIHICCICIIMWRYRWIRVTHCIQDFKLLLGLKHINLPETKRKRKFYILDVQERSESRSRVCAWVQQKLTHSAAYWKTLVITSRVYVLCASPVAHSPGPGAEKLCGWGWEPASPPPPHAPCSWVPARSSPAPAPCPHALDQTASWYPWTSVYPWYKHHEAQR